MASRCWFSLLLVLGYVLVDCTSAAVHGHSVDNVERESDGSFRARDSDHYGDSGHNVEFDHEAILGSVREAEEFDKLSPEESRRKLGELLPKMDLNQDSFIDRTELKKWILNSFINLSKEEAVERLQEVDTNRDGIVSWSEYLHDTFGALSEEEIEADETGDSGMLIAEEKAMWQAADSNGDGELDAHEFEVFSNPEEHAEMHGHLVNQTLREKDTNKDGRIDFQEFVGNRGSQQDKEWVLAEKHKFDHELDTDHNGHLDLKEIFAWIIPNNDEIADEEVDHLFASADDDHDDLLSFPEILDHHEVFVGSDAMDYGNDMLGEHFVDEL